MASTQLVARDPFRNAAGVAAVCIVYCVLDIAIAVRTDRSVERTAIVVAITCLAVVATAAVAGTRALHAFAAATIAAGGIAGATSFLWFDESVKEATAVAASTPIWFAAFAVIRRYRGGS